MRISRCDEEPFHAPSYELPLYDPLVNNYFALESSYIGTLTREINEGQYEKFFRGKKDMVFVDLGANVGLVSLYAAPACKRIVAIEPSPIVFPVLQAMTCLEKKIECFQGALSIVNTQVNFYLNDINQTASSTVNTYGERIAVQGFTLNSLLSIHQLEHVDLIKCDVEGGEGDLTFEQLRDARPIVKSWFIETHNCPASTWEHKLGTLVSHLSKCGYNNIQIDGMKLWAR